MINIDEARESVINWLKDFVEVPHPALQDWPPCPYAKQARVKGQIDFREGGNPYADLLTLSNSGMEEWEVIVFIYDPEDWPADKFEELIQKANEGPLAEAGLISLSDHPKHKEEVNGVCFNHGTYALSIAALTQNLNEGADKLYKKGYYKDFPKKYLDSLFKGRQDPRQS